MIKRTMCFVVTGEFITEHARSLWAERCPDRAVGLLMKGLQGIDLGQAMGVLTGKSKLVGDSSAGIELVEDDATMSPHGMPLPSLTAMFEGMQQRSEIAERDVADLIAMESGETTSLASPTGLRVVPRRTAADLKSGKVDWDGVRIYRELGQAGQEALLTDEPATRTLPPDPPPPPKPTRCIVTDTGWLSPDGKFYPCGLREHVSMATRIQRELHPDEEEPALGGWERSLEKQNWLKLAGHQGVFGGEREPTSRQKKLVLDWCLGEGKDQTPLPYWLEPGRKGDEE